ncbi:MFS transporter [Patescibacteria group bacterium]|nr:MFS transporter [Patescibacteria group bacterium]
MSVRPQSVLTKNAFLWAYIVLFKSGGMLFYSSLSLLGSAVFPLWMVGMLIGSASLIQLLMDFPAGVFLDRYGYARMLRYASFVLAGAGALLLVCGLRPWVFVVLIFLSAGGWLFFGPGVNAYLLSIAPPKEAGRYMGMRSIMSSGGAVISTLLLAIFVQGPIRFLALAILIPLLLASGTAFFLRKKTPSVHAHPVLETHHYYIRRKTIREIFQTMKRLNPASGMLALTTVAGSTFYGVVWFTIPLVIAEQLTKSPLHFGLSIFDVAVVLSGSLAGRLADTPQRRLWIFLGLSLFALCGMSLGFHLTGWFFLLGFLATVGDELANVSLWAWLNVLDRTHAHDGFIAATMSFFEDIGWMLGPLMAGFLYTFVGPGWTIFAGSSLIFICWIISGFVFYQKQTFQHHRVERIPEKPRRFPHKE